MKEEKFNKLNRTFARRIGKTLSDLNKFVLENDLPIVSYSPEKLEPTKYHNVKCNQLLTPLRIKL